MIVQSLAFNRYIKTTNKSLEDVEASQIMLGHRFEQLESEFKTLRFTQKMDRNVQDAYMQDTDDIVEILSGLKAQCVGKKAGQDKQFNQSLHRLRKSKQSMEMREHHDS